MEVWTKGAKDVLAERERQAQEEGFDKSHDAAHDDRSLTAAAACYAQHAAQRGWLIEAYPPGEGVRRYRADSPPDDWPDTWGLEWWKPVDYRRDLVKAAALLLAEIDRIDAAETQKG